MESYDLSSILVKSGSAQLTVAFVWGLVIASAPFPRIALSTHLNLIQEGLMAIAAGLITRDPTLCQLEKWQLTFIVWSHLGMWFLDAASACNAFWGTNKFLVQV
jgi:hypothetical protein